MAESKQDLVNGGYHELRKMPRGDRAAILREAKRLGVPVSWTIRQALAQYAASLRKAAP